MYSTYVILYIKGEWNGEINYSLFNKKIRKGQLIHEQHMNIVGSKEHINLINICNIENISMSD